MTTQALSAYGIALRMGDGVAAGGVAVNSATNASPIIVGTPTAHGIVDVSVVTVFGVLGNTAANGTWIAERVTATSLKLRGSAGNGGYTGGGALAQTDTFATIAEMKDITDAGIQATLVDASAHDGINWVSRVPTLLSGNTMRLSLNLVPSTPTHNPSTGLEFLLLTKARRRFLLVFPGLSKTAWLFTAFVTAHKVSAPVAGILTAETMLEVIDAPTLVAA